MPRQTRHHMPPIDDTPGDALAPRALTRQEFARRLAKLRLTKNMSQADLARAAFGTTLDSAGRTVAKGRDSISSYEKGRTFPTPKTLQLLARALGVTPTELLPNTIAAAIDEEIPAVELKQAPGHPDHAWLRINRMVSFETGAKIVTLLQEDDRQRRQEK